MGVSGVKGVDVNGGTPVAGLRLGRNYGIGIISLRNLVSGYKCGRVFPAGVGPSLPHEMQLADCLRVSSCQVRRSGGMVG